MPNLTKESEKVVTPAEFLLNVADYIDEHGWTQGVFSDSEGHVCTLGAVIAVKDELYRSGTINAAFDTTVMVAQEKLESALPTNSISRWNDRPWQTQENVVTTIRAVATKLNKKHWWSRR